MLGAVIFYATLLTAGEVTQPDPAYQAALAAPATQHDELLIKAANAGSINAAARLINCNQADRLETIDERLPEIMAWQEVSEPIMGMTGKQIYGLLLYYRISKSAEKLTKAERDVGYLHARGLIDSAPVGNPVMKYFHCNLWLMALSPEEVGNKTKGITLFKEATQELASHNGTQEPRVQLEWLGLLGSMHGWATVFGVKELSDHVKAASEYQQAAAIAEKLGLPERQGYMLHSQAMSSIPEKPKGDWAPAVALMAASAKAYGEAGLKVKQAGSLEVQASFQKPNNRRKGDWAQVELLYTEAAKLRGEAGDVAGQAKTLYNMARSFTSDDHPQDNWPKTTKLFADAHKLFVQVGDKKMQGECLHWQSISHTGWDATKKDEASRSLARQAAVLLRETGNEGMALEADNWAK